jgi:hypothetical protein
LIELLISRRGRTMHGSEILDVVEACPGDRGRGDSSGHLANQKIIEVPIHRIGLGGGVSSTKRPVKHPPTRSLGESDLAAHGTTPV